MVGLALTGCGQAAENIAERTLEEAAEAGGATGDVDVDIDTDGGEVSIDTDDGSVTVGGDGLPQTWPDDVPVTDGEIVAATSTTSGAEIISTVTVVTEEGVADVATTVKSDITEAGFSVVEENEATAGDGGTWQVVATRGSAGLQVQVVGSGSESTVTYTIAEPAS